MFCIRHGGCFRVYDSALCAWRRHQIRCSRAVRVTGWWLRSQAASDPRQWNPSKGLRRSLRAWSSWCRSHHEARPHLSVCFSCHWSIFTLLNGVALVLQVASGTHSLHGLTHSHIRIAFSLALCHIFGVKRCNSCSSGA
jgi:hypothetical protein